MSRRCLLRDVETFRRDQYIDEWQKFVHTFVDVIDVGGNDCTGRACFLGHARTGARIVRVDVEYSRSAGQIKWRFVSSVTNTLISIPKHGSLASFRFNNDIADLGPCSFYNFRKLNINTFIAQRLQSQAAFRICAKRPA